MSEIIKVNNPKLNSVIFETEHESGLKIIVYPLKEYTTSCVIFGTKFGSIDTNLINKKGEHIRIPEGVAHFLEHKMFENKDGKDAFEFFAETGASANAFTSFEETCYTFSAATELEKNLEILLRFVMSPHFTEQTVKKEQGIIGQEIKMYEDDPGWQVFFGTLTAMYQEHPIREDIAGSVDSIAKITPELLRDCHSVFYALDNMILTVAGNTSISVVMGVVDKVCKELAVFPKRKCGRLGRSDIFEPKEIKKSYVQKTLPVAIPLITIGFKEESDSLPENFRKSFVLEILLELLFGETSEFYKQNYEEGLITEPCGLKVMFGEGYLALLISAETQQPEEFGKRLLTEVTKLREHGLSQEDFEICKIAMFARYIKATEDLENMAFILFEFSRIGFNYDEVLHRIEELSFSDVEEALKSGMQAKNTVISVVKSSE